MKWRGRKGGTRGTGRTGWWLPHLEVSADGSHGHDGVVGGEEDRVLDPPTAATATATTTTATAATAAIATAIAIPTTTHSHLRRQQMTVPPHQVVRRGNVAAVRAVVQVAVAVTVPAGRVGVSDEGALAAATGVVGIDKLGAAVVSKGEGGTTEHTRQG